jgi:ribosomal protein S18 acetylase RimI-like enzyme
MLFEEFEEDVERSEPLTQALPPDAEERKVSAAEARRLARAEQRRRRKARLEWEAKQPTLFDSLEESPDMMPVREDPAQKANEAGYKVVSDVRLYQDQDQLGRKIFAMINDTFGYGVDQYDPKRNMLSAEIEKSLREGTVVVAVDRQNNLVGFVIRRGTVKDKNLATVIASGHRGKGVGHLLLDEHFRRIRDEGLENFGIQVTDKAGLKGRAWRFFEDYFKLRGGIRLEVYPDEGWFYCTVTPAFKPAEFEKAELLFIPSLPPYTGAGDTAVHIAIYDARDKMQAGDVIAASEILAELKADLEYGDIQRLNDKWYQQYPSELEVDLMSQDIPAALADVDILLQQAAVLAGQDQVQELVDEYGGIDLRPEIMGIEVRDGEFIEVPGGVQVPFDIKTFQGFTFKIIGIQRVDSVDAMLGLAPAGDQQASLPNNKEDDESRRTYPYFYNDYAILPERIKVAS